MPNDFNHQRTPLLEYPLFLNSRKQLPAYGTSLEYLMGLISQEIAPFCNAILNASGRPAGLGHSLPCRALEPETSLGNYLR